MKVAHKDDTLRFVSTLGLSVRATNVLLRMDVKAAAQFTALDEQTLLLRRNCGKRTAAEIMEAVMGYKASIESDDPKAQAPSLSAAIEQMPVTDLRLSVRVMGALERLKISKVGELVKVSDQELLDIFNFGKRSLHEVRSKLAVLSSRGFIVWPSQQHTAGGLSRLVTRAARKLQRLRSASALLSDDYRFGHLVREMGIQAKNAREAAGIILSRNVDPVDPQQLVQRLLQLVRVVQAGNRMFLEEELWNLTDGLGSDRNRRIILSRLGWDGRPPRTLETVGEAYNMTRERARQICTRIERIRSSKPFVPALDRAMNVVARAAPTLAEEIEAQLFQRRLTRTGFCVEALEAAARDLGRKPSFTVEMLYGHRVVVPISSGGFLYRIDQVARGAIRRWGVATVEDVAAAARTAASVMQKFLPTLPGFKWLDEPSGWFWIAEAPRNSLLTQVRKILAASPSINVGELRTGVGRHHRKKGFAPPRRVLLELCRQLPWCHVEGERIAAATPLNPHEILSESERIILKVLKEHGPVMQRMRFEHLCLDAGMNRHSFWVFLSYSPLICRHAAGVYGLRGSDVPAGLVESLAPKRTAKSKLIVDYGWTDDRKIQILYRVSEGMLGSGILSIPSALKAFLQGRFILRTGDDFKIGTLTVKDNSGWGLAPFFTRRGGEPGDYLSVMFDLSHRFATVQIGDAGFTDQIGDQTSTLDEICSPSKFGTTIANVTPDSSAG